MDHARPQTDISLLRSKDDDQLLIAEKRYVIAPVETSSRWWFVWIRSAGRDRWILLQAYFKVHHDFYSRASYP